MQLQDGSLTDVAPAPPSAPDLPASCSSDFECLGNPLIILFPLHRSSEQLSASRKLLAKSNWLPNRVNLSCGGRTAQLVGGERMSSAELSVLCRCQEVCAGLGRGAGLSEEEDTRGRMEGSAGQARA